MKCANTQFRLQYNTKEVDVSVPPPPSSSDFVQVSCMFGKIPVTGNMSSGVSLSQPPKHANDTLVEVQVPSPKESCSSSTDFKSENVAGSFEQIKNVEPEACHWAPMLIGLLRKVSNDEAFVVHVCCGGNFEFVNNIPMYLPLDCFRTRLKLPLASQKPINRRVLLRKILKKFELPPNAPVSLRYIDNNHIFDITDDHEDFFEFLKHAVTNEPIDIYVVDKVRMLQPGQNSQTHQPQQNPQTHHLQQNLRILESQPNKQTHHLQKEQDEIHNSEPNLETHYSEEKQAEIPPPNTEEFDFFNHGAENVCKIKKIENPFIPVVGSSESDEASDEEDEDEEDEEKQDVFWNMPTLHSQQDEENPEFTTPIPTTYQVSDLVKVRQTFSNKEEFLNQLFTKCLEENFQIKPVKSDKSRYTAKCVLPNCEWKCSAYKIRHTENFMVKKLHDVHTCSRTQIMGNNKHATKKVLGSILMDSFKAANREYKPKDIRDDVANRFRVSVSYNQAWRAKCQAIEMLRGSSDDSFRMLPIYLHNLKIHNPGTITNLVTDKENKFVMCYMSIGVVIRSFVQHVRPIIIVDAAHLKGGYLGTNLVAVAMDGNNGILPLAYGIGEGETNSVWSWFFGNLRDHLMSYGMVDHMSEITFISDRAASIAHGIANVFPEAFHAHCARHLFMNIKTKSNKMKFFEWHFWKMVKAYRASDFHDHLDVFRRRLKASYKVLCEDGINRWSRSQSTHIRIGISNRPKYNPFPPLTDFPELEIHL
ncbi:uncharacterized protein [Rutidosis leptorrhynchoides]|uniref:uncharacterized protein n=1 Tax=Rutidosis leptorrhynchoides TaxID=125765 RepID=UPI003A9A1C43